MRFSRMIAALVLIAACASVTPAAVAGVHWAAADGEMTIVSGRLVHHRFTRDLFHIDHLWMRVAPGSGFHRWLSQGIDRNVAIIATNDPARFADVEDVRILSGTLIHEIAPADPLLHVFFLRDWVTGTIGAVTFETEDPATAGRLDAYYNVNVSLIMRIQ